MQRRFLIEDQGDGWWHCASPLACEILDGPGRCAAFAARRPADDPDRFVLVATTPAIVWNGEPVFAATWGADHPLCHPIEPTTRALVVVRSRGSVVDLNRDFGIPVYPALPTARSLGDAEPIVGLGMKVAVYRGKSPNGPARPT